MNCNKDALLDELTDFASQKPTEIPTSLDDYLGNVAKTGDTLFPWQNLKPLLCRKLELVMNEFYKQYPTDDLPALPNVEPFKYEDMKARILESINCFSSAPFTIQRLCELVVDPRKHYRRTDKFMRGLEKNVLVVSTVEPKSVVTAQDTAAGTVPMVNGMPGLEDGGINGHLADSTEDVPSAHFEPEVSDLCSEGKAEAESSTASVVEVQASNAEESPAGVEQPGTNEDEAEPEKMEAVEEEKPSSSEEAAVHEVAEEPEASVDPAEVTPPPATEKPASPAIQECAADKICTAANKDTEGKLCNAEVVQPKADDEKKENVDAEEPGDKPKEPEVVSEEPKVTSEEPKVTSEEPDAMSEDADGTSESTISSATPDASEPDAAGSAEGPPDVTEEPPLKKFHLEPESSPMEEPPLAAAIVAEDCVAEKEVTTPPASEEAGDSPDQPPEKAPQADSSADCPAGTPAADAPAAKEFEDEPMDQN